LSGLEWGAETSTAGVREQLFDLHRGERRVPGVFWSPGDGAAPGAAGDLAPRPLVLIGHGGSGHKRQDYVLAVARRFVRHHGFCAAAIDGPCHGDRRDPQRSSERLSLLDFSQLWQSDATMTDEMVADWREVLAALGDDGGVGRGPVGYWGLSMGTIIGLPLVAAEERVGVAVLGLMGLTGPTRERIAADAPRITCPVLFLLQRDDELFNYEAGLALFDALGAADRRLHVNVGGHVDVPADEFAATERFLARHLSAG
jgi:pimeloyl-ACP methyl ester carboxylesterase